jgi:hypothetical protein
MNRPRPSYLRSVLLVLVLAVGPIQAQTMFACAMMDTVMHADCCCGDRAVHRGCVDSSCDAALESGRDPCCEQSVELGIDDDARQDSPVVNPAVVRSDVDPPQAIVASFDALVPAQSVQTPCVFQPYSDTGQSSSDIYLVTQRLRI